jgi:hypothetical protein
LPPNAPTPTAERQPVWELGVAAAVVASVATTALAAVASAAGISFADGTGASIPIAGFAQRTLVFSLVGVGMAAVMARKARRPRRTFARTAVALTGAVLGSGPHVRIGHRLRGHPDHAAHRRRGDRVPTLARAHALTGLEPCH